MGHPKAEPEMRMWCKSFIWEAVPLSPGGIRRGERQPNKAGSLQALSPEVLRTALGMAPWRGVRLL